VQLESGAPAINLPAVHLPPYVAPCHPYAAAAQAAFAPRPGAGRRAARQGNADHRAAGRANAARAALAALPGLVLYLFRWVLVLGRLPRRVAARLWVFTLLDELWGLGLYLHAYDAPTARQLRYLKWSVGLGLLFTLAALAEIAYQRYGEWRSLRRALMRPA
jgi:hypothetical protein